MGTVVFAEEGILLESQIKSESNHVLIEYGDQEEVLIRIEDKAGNLLREQRDSLNWTVVSRTLVNTQDATKSYILFSFFH